MSSMSAADVSRTVSRSPSAVLPPLPPTSPAGRNRNHPPSTSGINEFISAADYEMKSLMDYLELAGDQMKKGSELDEINDLKKYIALTLSHWKRNASVATEGYFELSGLLNLEKNIIQSQQSLITEQDHLLTLLDQEKDNINSKVKEVESHLQSSGVVSDDLYINNTDSL